MSRPDLEFLRDAVGLGSVFDATVVEVDAGRGLVHLAFDGGRLVVPRGDLSFGTSVRVRVPARDVILASTPPHGVSVQNVLTGTVSAIHPGPARDEAVVQVAVGSLLLLAEVTRDAVDRLGLAPGRPVHALVKSMSIDVRVVGGATPRAAQ